MNKVCCIIDVDGFSVKRAGANTYREEFLVRELAYIRVDPAVYYLPRSYRFDLRGTFDFDKCTAEVKRTVCYQTKVIGLGTYPGPKETDTLNLDVLPKMIKKIYNRSKTFGATVVAFKGGHREMDLLKKYRIPFLDLQHFGCPSFENLLNSSENKNYEDCGHHRTVQGRVAHCPMAEVAAYRDWFMSNVEKFIGSSSEPCAGTSDCDCEDCR